MTRDEVLIKMNKLRIEITYNIGFGTVTISLINLPLYGEGPNIDEAVDDLINSVFEFIEIYQYENEIYQAQFTESQMEAMESILECHSDRDSIRRLLPLSYMSIR